MTLTLCLRKSSDVCRKALFLAPKVSANGLSDMAIDDDDDDSCQLIEFSIHLSIFAFLDDVFFFFFFS